MSVEGQTEKNSVRAYVFRFALKLGHRSTQSACLKRAKPGTSRVVPSGRECATRLSVERYGASQLVLAFQKPHFTEPLFESADIPGSVANPGQISKAGNDSIEFLWFCRLGDKRGDDFSAILGPMKHLYLS
jgi:hypothetical protein